MNTTIPCGIAGLCRQMLAFLALLAGLTLASAQADNGSISGRVTDKTGGPLSGAIVTLKENGRHTSTARDGTFHLSGVPVGEYSAEVSYLGLPSKAFPVIVTAEASAMLLAELGDDVLVLEALTIEGTRAGQARALNEQRASGNLKSIVTSDALGRFPDQNAAETLQRISGISLERDQGEGRYVVIRGIDPDLNNTQLNGISLPASEDDTRKVNLDVIPSDLIESVEVTKAVTPDMDGDAIGGSVNLKTQTAFSSEGRVLRGSAEGQYSDLSGQWGHRLSFNYGNVFNDGKVGVMLSLSDQKRRFGSDNRETGDPWELEDGVYLPGGDHEFREYVVRRTRQGASLSLDFRPDADNSYYLRAVWNDYTDYEYRYATILGGDPGDTTPASGSNGLLGTVSDGGIALSLKDREEQNNLWSLSAGGEHRRGNLTIDYVASQARAELVTPNSVDAEFEGPDSDFTYDYRDPSNPRYSGAFTALAAGDFELDEFEVGTSRSSEEETSFAFNVKAETSFGGAPGFWKAGLKHRAKQKVVNNTIDLYGDDSDGALTLAGVNRANTGRSLGAAFGNIDGPALRAYFAANPGHFEYEDDDSVISSTVEDYETDEDVTAAYVMGSVTFDRLTLTGGVRGERTKFATRGWQVEDEDPDTLTRIAARSSYDDLLPSLHARFDFTPRLIGRAAWTQTLARPKFPDSAFRREIDDDGNYIEGNPNLSPYRSNNFDAALEFYPQSLGVISAGFFQKKIDDFIFRQVLGGAAPGGADLITPLNGRSADISGIELAWQQQFSMLPAPFDGFGLHANLTLSDSEADLGSARPGEKLPFAKQSDRIANYALSYEKHGFFLRVAANYRSSYLDEVGEEAEEDLYVQARWQVDVSTSYKISERYSMYAEFLNVTNEPFVAHWGGSDRLMQVEFYNWAANVGMKFNF